MSEAPDPSRVDEIRRAIHDGFADVPYPGDHDLAVDPEDDKGKSILLHLKGHRWHDSLERVAEWLDEICVLFLTPAARHHYLPAFLLAALGNVPDTTEITRWTLYALEPPDAMDRFRREFSAYTSSQKSAVRGFLQHIRDHVSLHDDRRLSESALERYWADAPSTSVAATQGARRGSRAEDHLKDALRAAFADVPYPGDRAIAYNPDAYEADELDRDFRGYPWRELPRGIVRYHRDSLHFFSEHGLHHYLPAYLFAVLDGEEDLASWVVSRLCNEGKNEHLERSFHLFTPPQRAAVGRFLAYLRKDRPQVSLTSLARQPVCQFWGLPDPVR